MVVAPFSEEDIQILAMVCYHPQCDDTSGHAASRSWVKIVGGVLGEAKGAYLWNG